MMNLAIRIKKAREYLRSAMEIMETVEDFDAVMDDAYFYVESALTELEGNKSE